MPHPTTPEAAYKAYRRNIKANTLATAAEALDLTPEDLGDAGRTYDADGKVATDWNEKEQMELENKLFEESAQ